MKKIITLIGLLLLTGSMYAQTLPNTENYIQTKVYLDSANTNKQIHTVQYFDGLGRPKQIVNVKASPLGRDVVTHIEYDPFGRQVRDYLPVPQPGTLNGAIVPNPLANATQPSLYGSEKIYAEKILENSPLDRIQQQIQVGNAWSSKPVKFTYETNAANEVKKFIATAVWSNSTTASSISSTVGYYPASQLYKNTVTDEDGNKTIEFKNGKGQVILVRKVLNATENADTYYVYNDYDQLAFVIPPKAAAASDISTVLAGLCYWYRYDGKGRPVLKKLPGKSWEYTIYDKADRVIMTQDAVMGASKQWLFTKYDAFGRVAYTGIYTSAQAYGPAGREAEQKLVDNLGINKVTRTSSVGFTDVSGMQVYYDNNAATSYPSTGIKVLSVNYYDSYPPGSPAVTNVFAQPLLKDDPLQNRSTKGLPVASYVKNIEDDNWTKTYTWYDTKGRVIGSRSINHLGGYTVLNHKLDFSGTILQTNTYHKRLASDTQRNIIEYFTYDSQNRLTMHRHKVDSNPVEILAQNKYNELSQLESKKVGGVVATSPLQQIDYKYNIRGWMTKINDPSNLNGKLFGYEMRYQSPLNTLFAIGRYNGNIAEIDWRTSKDDVLKRYSYSYDSLNRLNYGHYSEPNGTVPEEDHFGETTEYDLNGNITRLYRNTKNTTNGLAMQIDNLTYTYSGNQLTKVTDASQNYSGYTGGGNTITYDLNGNMISHLDKGLNEIKYNYLNLPVLVKKNNNSSPYGSLSSYLYRTDGTKLKKIYSYYKSDWQGNTSLALATTDYLDGFQYVLESSGLGCVDCPPVSPTLQFMPTAEGYFDFVKNKYIYNYVDHLGNIRLSYFNDGTATVVLDENNYYPFGLKHEGVNVLAGNPAYQYKYNGKELQESGMYDYGARMYMADLGRWGVHDPLSELQFAYSPYSYVYGNPIRFNDPTGMIGEEDPPKKGSTPDNPIDIGEIKLTKNVSDSKLSFMGIQSLNAYHGSQDRLAFGIRNSKAALATEKFEKNLAQGMITFGMGGSNLLASAGWTAFDTYLSYQDDDTQEAVGTIQLMAMLIQVSHGNTNGIQKFVNVDASRINIAKGITRFTPLRLSGEPVSAGWKHVLEGHFNRPLGNNRSVFSTTEEQLKNILQSKTVINSPLTPLTGGQFQRTVDTGQIIGNASLKQGGAATSWINVITDYKGNLITTYPIAP